MINLDEKIQWLEKIIVDRFGLNIILVEDFERYYLKMDGDEKRILIDKCIPEFENGKTIKHCAMWNSADEGWDYAIQKLIPMPGKKSVEYPLTYELGNDTHLKYDILGLAFWSFNRLEEGDSTDLDKHDRYRYTDSAAYKFGYLNRPIVDEWMHILKQMICRTWSNFYFKERSFNILLSHDVDRPARYGFSNVKELSRRMAGDIFYRRNIKDAIRAPFIKINTKTKIDPRDPYNTFEWIMSQSESVGVVSEFYFIWDNINRNMDSNYNIKHLAIRSLINNISNRGHLIGLHPSYDSINNTGYISRQSKIMKDYCLSLNIKQEKWGGRMHYLRWRHSETLLEWEHAGLDYDSTLGYVDIPGFRCGTCHEFPGYDLINGKVLDIKLRPLIAMECSILKLDMNDRDFVKAYDKFIDLKNICEKVKGNFTLLWHNSELYSNELRLLYSSIIKR